MCTYLGLPIPRRIRGNDEAQRTEKYKMKEKDK
jgi:hypothetical protein